MTGWRGHQVLYFGDHPYSDLADVTLEHGWRTGAIIKELTVSRNNRNYFHLMMILQDEKLKSGLITGISVIKIYIWFFPIDSMF